MFYGWKVCFVSCMGNLLVVGGVTYIMNAFMEPMTLLHGWTRGDIGTAVGLGTFCGTISMPILASLAMHYSLRLLTTLGMALGGLAFMGLGYADSLPVFTALFALAWVAGQACGGVVGNALMGNWFIRFRGRAFGVANLGTSLSGAILPFLALVLINLFDVRMAFLLIGGCILAFTPLCHVVVRDKPEDMGLLPDNRAADEPGASSVPPRTVIVPWKDLLSYRDAYCIGLAFGFGLLAAAGVLGQLKPRFADLGFSDYTAMTFMCLTALCAAAGKYLWGWVCDRKTPLYSAKLLMIANVCTLGVAMLPPTVFAVTLFVTVGGACLGGFWTVLPAVVAHVVGRERFVSVYRFVTVFISFKALGYPVMGFSYQWTGSYDAGYVLCIGLLILCFFLMLMVREPVGEPGAAFAPENSVSDASCQKVER